MTVQNGICMDHVYVGLDDDAFLPIAKWIKNLSATKHDVVHSGDDQWEGVYIRTRVNTYLEILRRQDSGGGIGFAFSSVLPHCLDGRDIVKEFPNLPWKQGLRVDADHHPWFDWYSLSDYDNMKLFPPCSVWLMHYHTRPFPWPFRRPKPSVDAITELAVTGCMAMREEIARMIPWTPIRVEEGYHENIYILPDRDESELPVRVLFEDFPATPGNEFKLRHIEFRLAPGAAVPVPPPSPWVMTEPRPGHIRLSLPQD